MIVRALVAALVATLITGEAQAHSAVYVPMIVPSPPARPGSAAGDYSKFHDVAIISAVGENLTIHSNGFIGGTKKIDISNWKMDDEMSASIQQNLKGQFQFKTVAYDRARLAAIPNGPWNSPQNGLSAFLATVPNDGVDAFIVVRPDLVRNAPGYPGLAFQNGEAFHSSTLWLWANYEIDIVDAKTRSVIGEAYSQLDLGGHVEFAGISTRDPGLKLDDDALNATDEQLAKIHTLLSALMAASATATLHALNLPPTPTTAGAQATDAK
jgi:hypothetical protein